MTAPGGDDFCWQAVVPRIVNPTKVTIIELLWREKRPLSADRMARRIDDPEFTVARLHYHCETLLKAGILRLEGVVPRKGSKEKFYGLSARVANRT
jgi:predicted transcriptional regulator